MFTYDSENRKLEWRWIKTSSANDGLVTFQLWHARDREAFDLPVEPHFKAERSVQNLEGGYEEIFSQEFQGKFELAMKDSNCLIFKVTGPALVIGV